jgi:hypothetical protein
MKCKSAIVAGVCVALGLVLSSSSASGFEETLAPVGKPTAPAGAVSEQPLPGVELTVPSAAGNGAQTGVGITIPGLGSLGALPKLDFGLELLYGAPEAKATGEAPTELPPDALTVYGTVKKTF